MRDDGRWAMVVVDGSGELDRCAEAGAREDEAVGLEGINERRGRGGSCGLCEG
jgi:hypothetical protein